VRRWRANQLLHGLVADHALQAQQALLIRKVLWMGRAPVIPLTTRCGRRVPPPGAPRELPHARERSSHPGALAVLTPPGGGERAYDRPSEGHREGGFEWP
jgi:hypothetical protein